MTTVGKILVVLHLVMSFMFMAFAGAVFTANKNWYAAANANLKKYNDEKSKRNDQTNEFNKKEEDSKAKILAYQGDVSRLEGLNSSLKKEVEKLTADTAALTLKFDGMRDQANLSTTEAAERRAETAIRQVENQKFYEARQEALKRIHEVEDDKFKLEVENQQIKDKHAALLKDMAIVQQYLRSNNLKTDPREMAALTQPPPPVDGVIKEYKKDKKTNQELVTVSLGTDDGLLVGHKMTVMNRDKGYLGRIRLIHVEADNAVGLVEAKDKNRVIQKGDNVTTKL